MIAFRDDLPLVCFASGEVLAFRRDWLLRSLAFSALRAGYPHWWLAEHVVESVVCYLRLSYAGNVVTVPRLEKAVRSALQSIGFGEIAACFATEPPFARIDLPAIAAEAGHGYELLFFELLDRELGNALTKGRNYIEFDGLAPCVKALRSNKIWGPGCSCLREEIVVFARKRIESLRPERDILFTLT